MRTLRSWRAVALAATTVATLIGCALAAPAAAGAASEPAGSAPVVYVSVPANNAVEVFAQGGNLKTPLRTITDGLFTPLGLFVDQNENLYVANTASHKPGYILVFANGAAKASKRIGVPAAFGYPTQLWVAADGTIFAANCLQNACEIDRYSVAGKWSHVTTPNISFEGGLVGDNQGDLYVSGSSGLLNGGIVEALFAGAKNWQTIGFPFTISPGQLAFDLLGRLTIADSDVGNVFSYQISLLQLQDAFRCYNCSSIAFDAAGTQLWALTAAAPSSLDAFQFPGGAPMKSVQLPVAAYALAVSPAFQPPPPSAKGGVRGSRTGG